jgi:Ribbon-helix-helix protein, copG family
MKGAMADKEDIQVHEGRRAGVVVSVRLKPAEADLLEALAKRDGRTLSETLRVALHLMASSPGAGRELALYGELAPTTRGEWDEQRTDPVLT